MSSDGAYFVSAHRSWTCRENCTPLAARLGPSSAPEGSSQASFWHKLAFWKTPLRGYAEPTNIVYVTQPGEKLIS